MAQKGRVHTQSSGGRLARPVFSQRERFSPATDTNEEGSEWMVQGRGRARTGMSTRAARLTHPHTTPPSNKSNSTAQHTEPSPAAQRAMASAAQAQQRASDPAPVASPVQHPSSSVAPEPLPEGGPNPSSTADAGAPDSNNDGSERQEQAAAEQTYD